LRLSSLPKQLRQIIFKRLNFPVEIRILSEQKPEASLVADRSLILPDKKCFDVMQALQKLQ
jgi:hypothetical protein